MVVCLCCLGMLVFVGFGSLIVGIYVRGLSGWGFLVLRYVDCFVDMLGLLLICCCFCFELLLFVGCWVVCLVVIVGCLVAVGLLLFDCAGLVCRL